MDTKQALRELGVGDDLFTPEQRRALDTDGFVILPNVFSADQCRQAAEEFDRLSAIEGEEGGREVHTEPGAPRVSNIFNKTTVYDFCLTCKPLLAAARYLLGEIKLHGANLREPLPGRGDQDLHCDAPRRFPGDWQVLNGLILFDDMTQDNGATRVVPGSHLWPLIPRRGSPRPEGLSPEDAARLPEDPHEPYPGEIYVTAPAGSIVAINGVIWHGGTRNTSGARRRQLHLSFTRRDLPQQLNQRDHLTPGLYDRLSPALRYLMDVEKLKDLVAAA
jgi:ectoine hydroxylase-related dioxygenase (phytanoyl-CoA dioxygenase family)